MKKALLISICLMAIISFTILPASGDTFDQGYDISWTSYGSKAIAENYIVAQSFNCSQLNVGSLELYIQRNSAYNYDLNVYIVKTYNGDTPTGPEINGSKTIPYGDVPTSFSWVEVNFTTAIDTDPFDLYWIVLKPSTGGNEIAYYCRLSDQDDYESGNEYDNGGDYDIWFKTYYRGDPYPEISTNQLVFLISCTLIIVGIVYRKKLKN